MYRVGDTVEADLFPDGVYDEPKWLRCEVIRADADRYYVRVVDRRSNAPQDMEFTATEEFVRDA